MMDENKEARKGRKRIAGKKTSVLQLLRAGGAKERIQ